MKKNTKIFLLWLILVVAWNFGVPSAKPAYDVLVAILLSIFTIVLKKNI